VSPQTRAFRLFVVYPWMEGDDQNLGWALNQGWIVLATLRD
jgi:hypothetical protein